MDFNDIGQVSLIPLIRLHIRILLQSAARKEKEKNNTVLTWKQNMSEAHVKMHEAVIFPCSSKSFTSRVNPLLKL